MSPETTEQEAPYAYPNAVLGLIPRYREGALPDPITPSALKPFGISPNNAHRLLGALGFLGLIDDAGRSTGYFERLRRASAEEYPAALADVLRAAYRPVFEASTSRDDPAALDRVFQRYSPEDGQGLDGEGLGFLGGDHQAPQALGKGARRSRATALSEGFHSLAEEVGSGAELFVDGPEPQDEQGPREGTRDRRGAPLRGNEPLDGEEIGSLMRLFRRFPKQRVLAAA